MGRANMVKIDISMSGLRLNKLNRPYIKTNAAPMRPQTDKNRGTSFD
jgi:hypothetical protein